MRNIKIRRIILFSLALLSMDCTMCHASLKEYTRDYSAEFYPSDIDFTSFENTIENCKINYNGTMSKSSNIIIKSSSSSSKIVKASIIPEVKDSSGNIVAMPVKFKINNLGLGWEEHDDGCYYYKDFEKETTALYDSIRLIQPTWYELKNKKYSIDFNIITETLNSTDSSLIKSKKVTKDNTKEFYGDYKGFNFWVAGVMTMDRAKETFEDMKNQGFNAITILPWAFYYEDTGELIPELNPDKATNLAVSFEDLIILAKEYFPNVFLKLHYSVIKTGEKDRVASLAWTPSSENIKNKFLDKWKDMLVNKYIPLSVKYDLKGIFIGNESPSITNSNKEYWDVLIKECHDNNLKAMFSFAGIKEYKNSCFADDLDIVGLNIYQGLDVKVDNDTNNTAQLYGNIITYKNLQKIAFNCRNKGQKIVLSEIGASRNTGSIRDAGGWTFSEIDESSEYAQYQQYNAFLYNIADINLTDGIFIYSVDIRREGSPFTPYSAKHKSLTEKLLESYKCVGGVNDE